MFCLLLGFEDLAFSIGFGNSHKLSRLSIPFSLSFYSGMPIIFILPILIELGISC